VLASLLSWSCLDTTPVECPLHSLIIVDVESDLSVRVVGGIHTFDEFTFKVYILRVCEEHFPARLVRLHEKPTSHESSQIL